jgi:hypothetical protein
LSCLAWVEKKAETSEIQNRDEEEERQKSTTLTIKEGETQRYTGSLADAADDADEIK